MVRPVYETQFKIGTKGLQSNPEEMLPIAEVESVNIAWDDGVEEWNPVGGDGSVRRLKTSKGCTISMSAKRNTGDAGNDYIAGMAFKNGTDAYTKFELVLADGATMKMNCVVNVTSMGGDSTAVDALEFELLSDGPITLEPAALAAAKVEKK